MRDESFQSWGSSDSDSWERQPLFILVASLNKLVCLLQLYQDAVNETGGRSKGKSGKRI